MEQQKMERGLKPRHVEMIALGGTIGVGLFMGSANTIQMAGPSVLLCYAVTGVVMFFIMRIMGEMLYQEPVTGSFATYGHKYISPFVGYLVLTGFSGSSSGYQRLQPWGFMYITGSRTCRNGYRLWLECL